MYTEMDLFQLNTMDACNFDLLNTSTAPTMLNTSAGYDVSISPTTAFTNNFFPPPAAAAPQMLRTESADSFLSATNSTKPDYLSLSGEPVRLTHAQTVVLERQFQESPKPSTRIRRGLAEITGLSMQRITAWFQTRRAKAKQQKRHEELQTRRILETAGRRRATLPDITMSASSPRSRPAAPRRAKSDAELINTLLPATHTQAQAQQKQYASPTEASYASLDRARSLAIAAAISAATHNPSPAATQYTSFPTPSPGPVSFLRTGSFHSPFPTSAFSDYGSTPCSTAAFTPLEDPFEYDRSASACGEQDYFALGTGGRDDYAAFADAVERADYSFVLPSFPPKRLLERRPGFSPEAQQQQQQRTMSPLGVEETPALDPFTLEKPQEKVVQENVEERYVTDTSASPKTPVADCAEARFLNVLDGGSAALYAGGEMFPFDCFLDV